jgi:hypothetical protein
VDAAWVQVRELALACVNVHGAATARLANSLHGFLACPSFAALFDEQDNDRE